MESYNGGLAQIRAQVETGNVHWDVVDLEFAESGTGVRRGIVLNSLTLTTCRRRQTAHLHATITLKARFRSVGAAEFSILPFYAYNDESFTGERPSTIEDFFDLEKFPGRRGMRRTAAVNVEFALLADGVPAEEVYTSLNTPEGVDRAFRKLDTIKEHIVWWEAGAQPPQMLADQEVVMSTAYNGRIFNAQVLENQPFTIVWDGQVPGLRTVLPS